VLRRVIRKPEQNFREDRMTGRHAPDKLALKRAARVLVQQVGGYEASAMHCRVGCSTLHDYSSADVIADLEALTIGQPGYPVVTRELAAQAGFALVALPAALPVGADLLKMLGPLSRELGEITGATCEALSPLSDAGADVSPREAKAIRAHLRRLIDAAVSMDAALAAMAGE
jgi:hypothetical protein